MQKTTLKDSIFFYVHWIFTYHEFNHKKGRHSVKTLRTYLQLCFFGGEGGGDFISFLPQFFR